MKQLLLPALAALIALPLTAAPVPADAAARAALAFARQNRLLSGHALGVGNPMPRESVWVVPLRPSGYVAVERDDAKPPIAAFSAEDFPSRPAPPMRSLLWRAPRVARASWLTVETPRHADWDALLAPRPTTLDASPDVPTDEVFTACAIRSFAYAWDQCLPYNLYAPGLSRARIPLTAGDDPLAELAQMGYGLRSACGCVATAVAQVATWFRWPYALRGTVGWEVEADGESFATAQMAAPGRPYDWPTLAQAVAPGIADAAGPEVGRFLQHWATVLKMNYDCEGSGGTEATMGRPESLLAMGYKVVSPESIAYRLTPAPGGGYEVDGLTDMPAERLATLYGQFRETLFTRRTPTPTGIAGHYIVCDGWAEEVDALLSADTRYARLNYGWGPDSGNNGWFALRAYDAGDGESVADDGRVFLQECFALLPLQCGQLVGLPAQGPLPTNVRWYEAPYWAERLPGAERTLRVVVFDGAPTDREADLAAAAESDANWSWADGALTMDRRVQLRSAALLPELFKGGEQVTVRLTRATFVDDAGEEAFVPDAEARDLLLLAETSESGETVELGALTLDEEETEGECVLPLPESLRGRAFRLLLVSGASPLDDDALAIPVDTLAYAVRGVTVENTLPAEERRFPLQAVSLPEATPGALAEALFPEIDFPEGTELWLALAIEADTPTHDALWSRMTVGALDEPPILDLASDRIGLPSPDTPIPFTVWDEAPETLTVTAYLSNALWLREDCREGFTLTPEEVAAGAFTLEGRANDDPSTPDSLTPGSPEATLRDAVLTLCAEDAAGNVAWAHSRLTWGLTPRLEAAGWSAGGADALLAALAFPKDAPPSETPFRDVAEAVARMEEAVALGYAPGALATTLWGLPQGAFRPRVEVLAVAPGRIDFRLADGVSQPRALAERVGTDPVILEIGAAPDALGAAGDCALTLDPKTGVYALRFSGAPPSAAFFRLRLR